MMRAALFLLAAAFPAVAATTLIAKLEQIERAGGPLLKPLMDGLDQVDDAGAQEVVEWLMPRRFKGDAPYLYMVGFYSAKQTASSRKVEGMDLLAKAALIYRVDTGRCVDAAENRAVPAFEGMIGMSVVREGLNKDPGLKALVIENALAYEKASGKRPFPTWICNFGSGPRKPAGEKAFQEHRKAMREQFATRF